MQEVFARLVPAMDQFVFDAQRGRFRSGLWRVTHNTLTDWFRSRATRDRAEKVWLEQHGTEEATSVEGTEMFFFCQGEPISDDDLRACFPASTVAAKLPPHNWLTLQRRQSKLKDN